MLVITQIIFLLYRRFIMHNSNPLKNSFCLHPTKIRIYHPRRYAIKLNVISTRNKISQYMFPCSLCFSYITIVCVLCKLSAAASMHKYKDSKISHIQPAPQLNDDSNVYKVQIVDEPVIKNDHSEQHHPKTISYDANKKHRSNHELLK